MKPLFPWTLVSIALLLASCDDSTPSSSTTEAPAPTSVAWSLDIDLGPGLSAITRDTSIRGFNSYSSIIHGRIRGYSPDAFADSVYIASIRGSAMCPLSDSGEFSVQAGRVLAMDGQTRLSISPTARSGFELTPDWISIIVYNF